MTSGQLVPMHVHAVLQLMASLVVEVVLACKEVNQKTRSAANDVLVDIAHAMHESAPPSLDPSAPHSTCKDVDLLDHTDTAEPFPAVMARSACCLCGVMECSPGVLSGYMRIKQHKSARGL
jgi:hypothetical protein